MAKQRESDVQRSGRFTASGSGNFTIIRSGSGAIRVYNTGKVAFKVRPKGNTATDQIPLHPKSSVDVNLANQDVVILHTAGSTEGVYEYIDPVTPIRSGRINGPHNEQLIIVQGREKELYRILNSGEDEFDVKVNGASRGTVRPRHSIDVWATDQQVTIDGAGPGAVQGTYDNLSRRIVSRSGRFKIKKVTKDNGDIIIDPTVPHSIINLVEYNKPVWYRIFNSGDNPIRINGSGAEIILPPKQSIDFNAFSTIITVKSEDLEQRIEGAYDFLKF